MDGHFQHSHTPVSLEEMETTNSHQVNWKRCTYAHDNGWHTKRNDNGWNEDEHTNQRRWGSRRDWHEPTSSSQSWRREEERGRHSYTDHRYCMASVRTEPMERRLQEALKERGLNYHINKHTCLSESSRGMASPFSLEELRNRHFHLLHKS